MTPSSILDSTALSDFVAAAYNRFGVGVEDGRGRLNPNYIKVPARLSDGTRLAHDPDRPPNLVDPIDFLADAVSDPRLGKNHVSPPCFTFVVGQYGLGKTELAFQVCDELNSQIPYRVVPVNLAQCRDNVHLLTDHPGEQDAFNLLFGHIARDAGLREADQASILGWIRDGTVWVILDALDELIGSANQFHRFLRCLTALVNGPGGTSEKPLYNIVVTVRFEFLKNIASGQEKDVSRRLRIPGAPRPAVYFLQLDYLQNSHLFSYFIVRNPRGLTDPQEKRAEGHRIYEHVKTNDRVLDMLRRPLLLRIFCDLLTVMGSEIQGILERLEDKEDLTQLLGIFVKKASVDSSLKQDQALLTPWTWDPDKLSFKSVKLYRQGMSVMTVEDVREILRPQDLQAPDPSSVDLTEDEILKGIHKCPFLRIEARKSPDPQHKPLVRFAHAIFLEYFTALGMFLAQAGKDFNAFDELVLSVDMRKFLRGLMGDEWYGRTRKSYALEPDDHAEWEHASEVDFDQLDDQRMLLLDAMTDPELSVRIGSTELDQAVENFLDHAELYHPRYLMYNFEAVSVYTAYRWGSEQGAQAKRKLSSVMLSRIRFALTHKDSINRATWVAWELLIERALNISQRLGYKWAKDYAKQGADLLSRIDTSDTRQRIEIIFEEIRNSLV